MTRAVMFTSDKGDLNFNLALTNNFAAAAAPTTANDASQAYSAGSVWIYAGVGYICTDPTIGAAVWVAGGGGSVLLTGAQAVAGIKTFSSPPVMSGASITAGTIPDAALVAPPVVGVATGYKLARSAAPVALDGSNPTSVAHGLTTCLSAHVSLAGSAAPGLSTSTLTVVINGANLDVYGWKPTGAGDTTLIASTGTETFNWIAVGT